MNLLFGDGGGAVYLCLKRLVCPAVEGPGHFAEQMGKSIGTPHPQAVQ